MNLENIWKIKKKQEGYSIFELIIYIALIGVVVSGMVLFSLSITNARNKNFVVQEVQSNGRVSLDIISQRIRASNGVNIGSSTFDTDPGVISLSMTDAAKNPTIIDLSSNDGRLRITEGVSSAVFLTSDEVKVTDFTLTNLTPGSERENIRIQLTIEYNNPSGDVNFDFTKSWQSAISLRQ